MKNRPLLERALAPDALREGAYALAGPLSPEDEEARHAAAVAAVGQFAWVPALPQEEENP